MSRSINHPYTFAKCLALVRNPATINEALLLERMAKVGFWEFHSRDATDAEVSEFIAHCCCIVATLGPGTHVGMAAANHLIDVVHHLDKALQGRLQKRIATRKK